MQKIQIIQNLLQPNGEVVLVKGEMVMVMMNIQRDEDDAIRDALRRAAEAGDAKKMEKIRALEAAHRLGGEE